jgi:hypothetical protein
MDENIRRARELDALDLIATELEKLRVLKEHEFAAFGSSTTRMAAGLTCPTTRGKEGLGLEPESPGPLLLASVTGRGALSVASWSSLGPYNALRPRV